MNRVVLKEPHSILVFISPFACLPGTCLILTRSSTKLQRTPPRISKLKCTYRVLLIKIASVGFRPKLQLYHSARGRTINAVLFFHPHPDQAFQRRIWQPIIYPSVKRCYIFATLRAFVCLQQSKTWIRSLVRRVFQTSSRPWRGKRHIWTQSKKKHICKYEL